MGKVKVGHAERRVVPPRAPAKLEHMRVVYSPRVTHLKYRVVR